MTGSPRSPASAPRVPWTRKREPRLLPRLSEQQGTARRLAQDVRSRLAHVELVEAFAVLQADDDQVSLPLCDLVDDGRTCLTRLPQLRLHGDVERPAHLRRPRQHRLAPL